MTAYNYNLFPASKDYEYDIYSVVIHNSTGKTVENIDIMYGDDSKDHKTIQHYQTIEQLPPHSYRKVNIRTTNILINPPYNVYVNVNNQRICTGYFGIGTGGFAIINIKQSGDHDLKLEKPSQDSLMYKSAYWKDRRKQDLLYWNDKKFMKIR